MPPRGHTKASSTSSPQLPSLPARFTVPPMPPVIHRRLRVSITDEGVSIAPAPSQEDDQEGKAVVGEQAGLLIRWGVRGKVEVNEGRAGRSGQTSDEDEDDDGVVIGGFLGIVRLWDAAYLLVFLAAKHRPFPLFPNHVNPSTRSDDPFLSREAGPSSHEVYALRDIHPIPLVPDLARKAVDRLRSLQVKKVVKKRSQGKGLNIRWNLPIPTLVTGAGTIPEEEMRALNVDVESDDDSDTDTGTYDEHSGRASRESLAPEADETPSPLPNDPTTSPLDVRAKKRFSLGWGRFMPKLGKPKGSKASPAELRESIAVDEPLVASDEQDEQDETPQMVSVGGTKTVVDPPPANAAPTPPNQPSSAPFASNPPQRRELESKIIAQIVREFSSGGFFYSYDFDLTHTLQHKRNLIVSRASSGTALANLLPREKDNGTGGVFPPTPEGKFARGSAPSSPREASAERLGSTATATATATGGSATPEMSREDDFVEPDIRVPLWRRVDRRFFWNEALLKDFVDVGAHAFVLPVMQGWVQSSTFTIPVPPNPLEPNVSLGNVPVDLVVISRRSRDRAGLRFQRRGIDDEGHVANFCETEMIVRAKVEGKTSLFSFVQVRGSIPLKWHQEPWSAKPPPVLDLPVAQSYSIANLHFDDLKSRYGPITVVNLSEQTGKEADVTNGYGELVNSLGRSDLTYKDFDFHAKCHGMNWDNISELVRDLDFAQMGYLWTLQGDCIREQSGAFRTNCIDCLDRTNVVQSALARHVLGAMLTQLGLIPDPATSTIESVFNDVWANNGDTLSLCYAHTSALKGDFVRRGKRDLSGMLHDGVSSISRMFYGAVSDFFAQAVISFFLGHRNLSVFSEFLENLESTDASNLIKLSRVRAAAIETSSARVLSEGEQRLAGWTLLSPEDRNVKLSPKLEEKVLLLTRVAIYVVSFNYSLEKVIGFTRIPLASITSIQKGAYILSPLQEAGRDPLENAGFVLYFSPANESTRYSTYSIRNKMPTSPSTPTHETPGTPAAHVEHAPIDPNASEFFAFKVLPREFIARGASSFVDEDEEGLDQDADVGESCTATVDRLVKRIREACMRLGVGEEEDFVLEKDVVSLAEAQSATSLLTRMDYALKRFLWL